jgi:L,D-peptidoglycan transpeptidase YkuD (ErfK/YbiS/YcfS/YnhG family)
LRVVRCATNPRQGILIAGAAQFKCALGRSGVIAAGLKREGDGATPRAQMQLRRVIYRADRMPRPSTLLSVRRMASMDAWCDDMQDRRYNTLIQRPPGPHEERLWREDHLYDVIIEMGWNDAPVRRGRGSAIFWHLARPGHSATAGCVAVSREVFAKILPRLSRQVHLVVI